MFFDEWWKGIRHKKTATLVSKYSAVKQQQQPPFYGYYTRQPALAGTSS